MEYHRIIKNCALKCNLLGDINYKLTIEEFALPKLGFVYHDWDGIGAAGASQEYTNEQMEKLLATFKMLGNQSELYAVMQALARWNFTGVVEDQQTGDSFAYEAYFTGRLGTIEPATRNRTSLHSHNYEIRDIRAYHVIENGKDLYKFNYYQEILEIGGRDLNAANRAILG